MDELQAEHRKDPHRRLLRHTYQEGPGFLFLATRGGRPPGASGRATMAACGCGRAPSGSPRRRASRRRWSSASAGRASIAGAPLRGRRSGGSPRPATRTAPRRLPAWVEQAVIVVRLLTYWNSKRLAAEFSRREIYPLGHHAVDALLAEFGTARPSSVASGGRRTSEPTQRAVAHRHQGAVLPAAREGRVHQGLDRRPRRRSFALPDRPARPAPTAAAPILAWLDDCLELCGTPLELMSDNGSPSSSGCRVS